MLFVRPYLVASILILTLCSSASAVTTWEVPPFDYTFERPANATTTVSYSWVSYGTIGTVSGTSAAFSSGGPGPGTRTGSRTTTATCTAPDEATSIRLVLMCGTTDGPYPVWWQQARKVGSTDPPKGGPFDADGPTTPTGEPVGPTGDPIAPTPKRYKARAAYNNVSAYSITIKETWTSEGTIIKMKTTSVPPRTAYDTGWCYYHKPFTIKLSFMVDGQDTDEPPIESPSDPVDENDPDEPELPDPGQPGGPGGPGMGGGGVVTTPTPEPPQVTPEPRPGEGDPNDEARHKELVGAVNRTTTAANDAMNQAKSDAAQGNSLLGGIKDGIGDLAGKLGEGEGDGDGFGPADSANLQKLTEGGGQEGDAPGEAESAAADGIRASVGGLVAAFGGLSNALQITGPGGTTSLTWNIDLPRVGARQISLEPYAGYISMVRVMMRWVCAVIFGFAYIRTIRGAFA